jgi:hypothetical protein
MYVVSHGTKSRTFDTEINERMLAGGDGNRQIVCSFFLIIQRKWHVVVQFAAKSNSTVILAI